MDVVDPPQRRNDARHPSGTSFTSATVHEKIRVLAPMDSVFARLSDREGMRGWPGINASVLVEPGQPRNGLGALRRVTALGLTLDERVVRFEPPTRYDYQIIRGLPVKHLGTVTLGECATNEVEVTWHVELRSAVPLLAPMVGAILRWGLPRALAHVAREAAADQSALS